MAPVRLSLCGEAVYSKSNNYGNNDQRIEDDLIANGKKKLKLQQKKLKKQKQLKNIITYDIPEKKESPKWKLRLGLL